MPHDSYELIFPLSSGEDSVSQTNIWKPVVGELRGIKRFDLLQMDVATCEKLLPRITELTQAEVSQLDPADFTEIMGIIAVFLRTRGHPRRYRWADY